MRKTARILFLVVLGTLSTAVLGAVTALMAAVSLAATALIVPGTGTPDANNVSRYMQHARDRYIAPFNAAPGPGQCTSGANCPLQGINYPASFFPLVIFPGWCEPGRCETWNNSVGQGVDGLYSALQNLPAENGPAVLFGYSQGGAVVSNTLRRLEGDPLMDKVSSVVLIGNAYNPDGGLFTRLGFLPPIPFLDITFGPPTPVDTGIPMTSIGFEYDPVMYAPLYWGNPFSFWNALAAFETVHGYYLTPNGNGPTDPIAYGYSATELAGILAGTCPGPNCRVDSYGNKYYMIPAKSLPIVDLVMSSVPAPLQPVVKPIADLISPVLKVLIDLGYDWSGDPGVPRTLSILPFNPIQNWPAVGVNLVAAAIQGIQAFIGDLGGLTTTIAPTAPAPATTTTVSPLALRSAPAELAKTTTLATEQVSEATASTPTLTVVKDEDTTEQTTVEEMHGTGGTSTEVKKDTTPTPENPPATKPEETTKPGKTTKPGETTSSGTSVVDKKDDVQKDATDNTDTDTDKKTDTDKETVTDKKYADSAKAAA